MHANEAASITERIRTNDRSTESGNVEATCLSSAGRQSFTQVDISFNFSEMRKLKSIIDEVRC